MPIHRVSRFWCCTTSRLRSAGGRTLLQLGAGLVEAAIDDGLLRGCVDRAMKPGFGSPAELSTAVVLLLEPPMDGTEGAGGQKVDQDVQHA